ncbi:hypothetical protein RchiOBHm_Chr2g0090561 [Rosa chinensis]|uniref:Uncharacterized protein n=1 Tax=Rosa chinensis TaxID=74649 RepID=A0A2P6RJG9_ROSCH|nr:hypothetical protein RchiOBHm_Chr2g0090561 [Rosa chinensis]
MASHGHGSNNMSVSTNSPKSSNAAEAPSPKGGGQCLCSPTTHQGSFRCRFHRSGSSSAWTKRPKSMPAANNSPATLSPTSVLDHST